MRAVLVLFVVGFALLASVAAGPRKVLVLPVDGNAPAAQRATIDRELLKLARANSDGDVTAGDATFADTATAVGCSPDDPDCEQTILSTLGVDEIVYGSATSQSGTTTVQLSRVARGEAAYGQVATLPESATDDVVSAQMQPLFSRGVMADLYVGSGSGSGSAVVADRPHPKSFFDSRERKLGVGLGAAGVTCLVIGFSLWSSAGHLQDQIDGHPTTTLAQLQDLHELEDRAGSKALWGNVFVLLGVGLAGTGAYYLYTDHKNRSTVVTPAPTDGGAQVVIGGRW